MQRSAREARLLILEPLPYNRLSRVARDLGVGEKEEDTSKELLGRLTRTRVYATDLLPHVLTKKELKLACLALELPVSGDKSTLISRLSSEVNSGRNIRTPSVPRIPAGNTAPEKCGGKPTATEYQDSDVSKGSLCGQGLNRLGHSTGWVRCSLCQASVKSRNIDTHLRKVHEQISTGDSASLSKGQGLRSVDILNAIGYEWCVEYARERLPASNAKELSDSQIVSAYLKLPGHSLLSLLRQLNEDELKIVAEYHDFDLSKYGGTVYNQLLMSLRKAACSSTEKLLYNPKSKKKKGKARKRNKRNAKSHKRKSSGGMFAGRTLPVRITGFVSGGAPGLGKRS